MKVADAPRPGWYPDPRGSHRLRWWDGTDWTDAERVRPTPSSVEGLAVAEEAVRDAARAAVPAPPAAPTQMGGLSRRDADELLAQVRESARSEVNRAADLFTARAQAATRQIQPLITDYSNRIIRPLRWAAAIALILVVAWIVFEVVVQASFFEWIGDRIDNLTNDEQ